MPIALVFVGVLILIVAWMLLAGQRRDDAWREFASETGGEFVRGGFLRSSKVVTRLPGGSMTMDTYSVPSGDSSTTYTRMKANLPAAQGLQFWLRRRSWVSKLDKALGTKEIATGNADFDREFVVHGHDDPRLKPLFSNQHIRQLLEGQHSAQLAVKDNELRLEVTGAVRDVERLSSLFELFKLAYDQLQG